jgi:hypothetical protein
LVFKNRIKSQNAVYDQALSSKDITGYHGYTQGYGMMPNEYGDFQGQQGSHPNGCYRDTGGNSEAYSTHWVGQYGNWAYTGHSGIDKDIRAHEGLGDYKHDEVHEISGDQYDEDFTDENSEHEDSKDEDFNDEDSNDETDEHRNDESTTVIKPTKSMKTIKTTNIMELMKLAEVM